MKEMATVPLKDRTEASAGGTQQSFSYYDLRMAALNGHAERARQDVVLAIGLVVRSLWDAKGRDAAWQFVNEHNKNALLLCVPRDKAGTTTLQHGLARFTFQIQQDHGRLTVAASRQGEEANSITFSPRAGANPRQLEWQATEVTYDGETSTVGTYATSQEVRQRGHDRLMQAAAALGRVATDASQAMDVEGPLAAQLSVTRVASLARR